VSEHYSITWLALSGALPTMPTYRFFFIALEFSLAASLTIVKESQPCSIVWKWIHTTQFETSFPCRLHCITI
jgi:hypothetical protein